MTFARLLLLVLATAGLLPVAQAAAPASTPPEPAAVEPGRDLAQQLGVMLQLENMLPKNNHFGDRAKEVDRQFALLEAAGVKWARQGIMWEQVEQKSGAWDWSPADQVVEAAQRHHVTLLWLVGNTAPWDSDNGEWNGVPKDLRDPNGHFTKFVTELVKRYQGRVEHWEIRNEPNLDYMWHGRDAGKFAVYLTEAEKAIKRVDPKATVVLGGLGGSVPQQIAWFKELLAALRAKDKKLPFEVADFHVYGGEADKKFSGTGSIAKYLDGCEAEITREMKAENLDAMPVWFTEFDYPAAVEFQAKDPDFRTGEAGQAKFVTELWPRFVAGHPDRKVFWASLLDDYDDAGPFASVGLFHSDKAHQIGAARPAYAALKRLLEPAGPPRPASR